MQSIKIIHKVFAATILLVFLSLTSCDPGYNGNFQINNQSSYELQMTYNPRNKDTTISIQPNSKIDFYHFRSLGYSDRLDCCVCEFLTITLHPSDTSKHLLKSISDTMSWTIAYPNKSNATCEFSVTEADIQ